MTATILKKMAGGRPPKFSEVRRPITVTLPERILNALAEVNSDRARAIVKCVEAAVGIGPDEENAVQLLEVLPGQALIVVGAGWALLKKIKWLRLVEIAPARHLLVLPTGMPIERLEVELLDLVEGLDSEAVAERHFLERLRNLVVTQRRKNAISKAEFLFVDV